jgi:membrane fusion protein (multidrug efflux system)
MNAERTEEHPAARASVAPAPAASTPAAVPRKPRERSIRKAIIITILIAAVVAGGIYGYGLYTFGLSHVGTDNAQIDGHIDPVIPRIGGYVTAVAANENDMVREGATIVQIDSRELELKLANAEVAVRSAEVALQTAQAGEHNAQAALAVAQANVRTATVTFDRTAADLARDRSLVAGGVITQQQFDASKSAHDAASAQLETARRQVAVAEAQVEVARSGVQSARSGLDARRNDVDFARLQLTYAKIDAPATGKISKKSVEVGQYVQAGQPLLAITEDSTLWVTANFKETDMEQIRPGEPVEIEVDGYPGVTFGGRVESIAAATGARFSLLPPDNATGNYVKVTQKIPVKIAIVETPAGDHPLRPGMSANVTVTTK